MLQIKGVSKYFGGLRAVNNVSLQVKEKELVGLIGPNGAGKTTLFNLITGVYGLSSGKIIFKENELTKLSPHQICKLGISRTHQIPRPFRDMTVLENVQVAGVFGKDKTATLEDSRKIGLEYLRTVGLENKKGTLAKHLTEVDRKLLELARSLATEPNLLLLDEILAGLNPGEMPRIQSLIKRIQDEFGITVLWCEHVMKAIMKTAERIIVLDQGEKIADGEPEKVSSDERVINSYLGEKLH